MSLAPRITTLGIALLLCACASSPLPRINTAGTRLAAGETPVVRDEELASDLLALQSMPVAGASEATERFVVALQRRVQLHDWKKPIRIEGRAGGWEISFDDHPLREQGGSEWSPGLFDRLFPASKFKLEGYDPLVAARGAGAPVVLGFEDVKTLRREMSFRPGNEAYVPATAVIEFGNRPGRDGTLPARVRLFNTFKIREAKLQGGTVELAYNLTASVEANLANTYIVKNGMAGLLRPDKNVDQLGLFGLDLYDPAKIPVVFVHGLNSSPAIWRSVVNDIYADPVLNARYQPLLFIYPTGLSVPGAGAHFRRRLNEYRATWDPDGNDANFDRMLIVGHSMGGLLTRLQVIDSGEELWKAFFTRPIDDNKWLTASQKATVKDALIFKSQDYVDRVVFVAVPHRGSKIADMSIVRFAIRLIKLPITAADMAAYAVTKERSSLNPALLRYNSLGLRSVDMLSPNHPYFTALDKRPITVPFHSIIGDRGKRNGSESSDGVVPYWSSHLDHAESEKVIPHGHSCTQKREAVAEILRILKLHAKAG